jgi:hypothetical protein
MGLALRPRSAEIQRNRTLRRLSPPARAWVFLGNLAALALGCALGFVSVPAHAQFVPPPPNQSLTPPFDYPPIMSATPTQVLPVDPLRRRIIFMNPSQTATIAFCPSQITRAGATFACAVNGAGSITLLPLRWQASFSTVGPCRVRLSQWGLPGSASRARTERLRLC